MKISLSKIARTFALLLLTICAHTLQAQPAGAIYANSQTTGGTGGAVTGAGNAVLIDETFATLTASRIVTASSTPVLNLIFADEIVATTGTPSTVYVRINTSSTALGADAVTIEAVNITSSVVASGFKTYYTFDGKVFLGITSTANFKTVRITITTPSVIGSRAMQVYYAFRPASPSNPYNPYPFNSADCGQPNATMKDASGTGLGVVDVTNPADAIDNQISTKSSFSTTGLFTSGHIKQTFLFNGQSNTKDAVRIVLSQSGSFAKADLAAGVTLRAYNGAGLVGSAVLMNALLDVSLLDLLGINESQLTFYFAPKETDGTSVIFDRIEIDLNIGGLSVGVNGVAINIHDIRRVPDLVNAPDITVCTNFTSVSLLATSLQKDIANIGSFSYAWYSDIRSGPLLSSSQNLIVSDLSLAGTKVYYAETLKSGTGARHHPEKRSR